MLKDASLTEGLHRTSPHTLSTFRRIPTFGDFYQNPTT